MNIKKLHIKGFKSLADFQLKDVSPFLVFAGANGSGKSNIADALAFMGAVVKFGASQARTQLGGFSQIHCYKYRKELRTSISFSMEVELDGNLHDYSLTIRSLDKKPQLAEMLKVDGKLLIDRRPGADLKVQMGESTGLQSLPDYPQDLAALMLLGQSPLRAFLTNTKVFRIDPMAAKEPDSSTTDTTELDTQGKNVASMLTVLEKDPDFRDQVLEWMELIVPGMESLSTEKQRLDGSTVITVGLTCYPITSKRLSIDWMKRVRKRFSSSRTWRMKLMCRRSETGCPISAFALRLWPSRHWRLGSWQTPRP
ncbi:hypothetical protein PF66_06461 [Pseudomonas asplenii]|uniref:Endonuclease GajA/Old nuclease/RecF-like AAA domain-containing protein n=1 Tax=Pseudomonas asplenii TaxID=53407 RepID=A0A0N0VI88_9PSED|nr:AAA family ATPase [Pseudomonas fuscovaginae]KPA86996.1 hypothetical protein PF66_06461 [Pseudomonas fuscovaginae]